MKYVLPFILLSILIGVSCGNKSASTNKEFVFDTDTISDTINEERLHNSFCYGKFEFSLDKINKNDFDSLHSKYYKAYRPKKIEDREKAKQLLGDLIDWGDENQSVLKIRFRNGNEKGFDSEDFPPSFRAYYPDLDILACDGGDGDLYINITSGCDQQQMGRPDLTYLSPNGKHGVTAFYNAQDIDDHFVFENNGMEYRHLVSISPTLIDKNMFSIIDSGFWTDNNTFYAKTKTLSQNETENEMGYYKLTIRPFERTTVPDHFKITPQKVGYISLNDDIKKLSYTYQIIEDKIYREGDAQPFYQIEKEGIELYPKYDDENGKFISSIDEIIVKNGKYATDKLIGAGSTIDELKKAYPDIKFSYSYIGGTFCASSKTSGAIQFLFNEKDFINKHKNLMDDDSVELYPTDFKPNTMVESIRIY